MNFNKFNGQQIRYYSDYGCHDTWENLEWIEHHNMEGCKCPDVFFKEKREKMGRERRLVEVKQAV